MKVERNNKVLHNSNGIESIPIGATPERGILYILHLFICPEFRKPRETRRDDSQRLKGKMSVKPLRHKFVHNGQTVYEWEQTLEEVRIYLEVPPGVRASNLAIVIRPSHLTIGIKGNPPYLDHDLGGMIIDEESTWTLDGQQLEITLQKMRKAETWPAAFKGHSQLNPVEAEEVKKKLTLERFQQEHPGFDFSGAEFSGMAPDPREFMGGVKYNNNG